MVTSSRKRSERGAASPVTRARVRLGRARPAEGGRGGRAARAVGGVGPMLGGAGGQGAAAAGKGSSILFTM